VETSVVAETIAMAIIENLAVVHVVPTIRVDHNETLVAAETNQVPFATIVVVEMVRPDATAAITTWTGRMVVAVIGCRDPMVEGAEEAVTWPVVPPKAVNAEVVGAGIMVVAASPREAGTVAGAASLTVVAVTMNADPLTGQVPVVVVADRPLMVVVVALARLMLVKAGGAVASPLLMEAPVTAVAATTKSGHIRRDRTTNVLAMKKNGARPVAVVVVADTGAIPLRWWPPGPDEAAAVIIPTTTRSRPKWRP
jgi:hypothetical protein